MLHSEFYIHTDQKSLIHLNEQRLHTPWQQKIFIKLLGLQYKVIYKKGVDNCAADALSRCPAAEPLMAITTVTPQWLLDIQHSNQSDPEAQSFAIQVSNQ